MMRDNLPPTADGGSPLAPQTDPLGSAAQTIRSLLQLAVVGLLIGVLLFQNVNLPVSVSGLFVVLLLWLIGRTSAMPLLVAFQLVLYFRETHQPATGGLGSFVFVVIVLGLLMFLGRDQTLRRLANRRVSDLVRSLFASRGDSPEALPVASPLPETSAELPPSSAFVRSVASMVACVLVAELLLIAFPIAGAADRGPQAIADTNRVLSPAPSLLVVVMATVIGLSALTWRKLSAQQASMYLRSMEVQLFYADLRMIVRSRLKFRRRRRRTSTKRTSTKLPVKVARQP